MQQVQHLCVEINGLLMVKSFISSRSRLKCIDILVFLGFFFTSPMLLSPQDNSVLLRSLL